MDNDMVSESINSTNDSSNFLVIIGIAVILILIWYLIFNSSEKFDSEMELNNLKQTINPEASLLNESVVQEAMNNQVKLEYDHNMRQKYNQMIKSNIDQGSLYDNSLYDNESSLSTQDEQTDVYKQVAHLNDGISGMTADDRSIALMNTVDSNKNINDVACNLSNTLSKQDNMTVKNYKNKYYNMYAHQIECNNNGTNGKTTGCGKKCYGNGMGLKKCNPTDMECMKSQRQLNNGPDFITLNQLALDNNNSRPCVTCLGDKIVSRADGVQTILDQVSKMDNVSRSFMKADVLDLEKFTTNEYENEYKNETSNELNQELKEKDKELVKKKKVTFNNVNNYANFNNYIDQNGVLETSVDKLAEIRTRPNGSATCGLQSYGKNISEVYDKLVNTPYMEYKKSCNMDKITGMLDDNANTSSYQNL